MLKKIRIKHLFIILPLVILAGFIGLKVFLAVKAKSSIQTTTGGQGGGGGRGGSGGARTQPVQTDVVASGKINEKVSLTGALRAKEKVDVSPKITGRLVRILVDTGQPVARGALIAVIEDDEIRQQVERSTAAIAVAEATIAQREAELGNAKAELDRKRQLIEAGLLSRIELDSLEMRYRVAQSQLELARALRRQTEAEQRELNIRQSQTRVHSPIAGLIANRLVDTGAMVSSGTPIVTVVSLSPMVIHAKASERDIARIRHGMPATITVDSLPGQRFSGRVGRISPLLDAQTRNGVVEIEIPNQGGMLKGEMFARVELDLGSSRETMLLSRDALVYRGDRPGVYVIESDKAKFIAVETGLTQEDKVELISGLKVGDTIITRGSNLIKDGDSVRVLGKPGQQGGPSQQQKTEDKSQKSEDGSQKSEDGMKQKREVRREKSEDRR